MEKGIKVVKHTKYIINGKSEIIITNIRIHTYSAAYENPIRGGKYTYPATEIVIREVIMDEGVDGVGWVHGSGMVIKAMLSLKDRVIDQDPFNVERIRERMYLPKVYGRRRLAAQAISDVDITLWDIKGKMAGRSVCQMMGGYVDRILVYIAGGYYEEGEGWDVLQSEVKENLKREAEAAKIRIGSVSIKEDLERMDAVRDAVGPDIHLLVDANNAYNRIDALKMGRELERKNIYWSEEPLSPDDIEGCVGFQRKLGISITIRENEHTRRGFKQLIEANAAQVLGGITEWRKVADLTISSHVLLTPHGDQEIHTHLAVSVPNGLIAGYYDNNTNTLLKDMFPEPVRPNELGQVMVPQTPELGMEIEYERIRPYCTYSFDDK